MRVVGRRPADPPFPRAVQLLGRRLPLLADPHMPHRDRRLMLQVIGAAVAKLEAEAARGLLGPADRSHLAAIVALALRRGRSGQHRGVFILGLADVRASRDAAYWTSALVHDGVHASVQARGRGLRYLDETGPCDAQIDYLIRTGAAPELIEHVRRFRDSRTRQRRRTAEPV